MSVYAWALDLKKKISVQLFLHCSSNHTIVHYSNIHFVLFLIHNLWNCVSFTKNRWKYFSTYIDKVTRLSSHYFWEHVNIVKTKCEFSK